jgi:phage terminase large subunit-like protein
MMEQHQTNMDKTKIQTMSKMMNDMSVTMKEMSGQMAKGTANPAMMKKMQERMKATNQMLEKMEKEKK